ncbi:beta-lactamase [Cellulomonas flavigena DSM 20109]|uniref:Beta-lactamase n=1 Tax=Cellulomonas flavigena (strain ATCC 482 / DSM 20109 / BCRC 11376 / JCM 18109 / NBRC 3775 / NCIMB 8073 / NRS 134) TaxID=446466 RepID=D5UHZ4_CELFN|nr:serine hydrolase domain-containing protein [Cellulomonas flavigena]ADG73418.1 beta-lactamase [Cellulomonas flavigena DSM 20109]
MPSTHRLAALVTAGALVSGSVVALPVAALAGDHARPAAHERGPRPPRHDDVQRALDRLVDEHGVPAALAAVTDRTGRERDLVAGVGDLATGAPVPVDGQVRAGSNSKTFVATVVLQLAGEGLVDLDASVETYLPGVVRGDRLDASVITVRDLLQHTSGIGDFTHGPPFTDEAVTEATFLRVKDWYVEPYELVTLGLSRPTTPHGTFAYSNTNYVLAGLVVQKVTQRPLAEAVTERIIEPLGLAGTYVPGRGERTLRGEHPQGYHAEPAGSAMVEHTAIDPAFAWAAGDVVTTPGDLNRFFTALVGGELLAPAEQAALTTTVPMGMPEPYTSMRYGLGIMSSELSCGGLAWGHGGIIPGYQTENAVTADGRAVTVATTTIFGALAPEHAAAVTTEVAELVDRTLCAAPRS